MNELIAKRKSIRAFSEQKVAPEKLELLFEAARWAPSSANEQPWRFIVATQENPEHFQALLACLNEGNRRWAKDASVLILTVAKMSFSHSGKPNRYAFHDLGLALGNLTIQATALDLFVHPMAGFDDAKARKDLQIPEDFEPVVIAAIGYLGNPDNLPEDLRQRELSPRVRRPISEIVFAGSWTPGRQTW